MRFGAGRSRGKAAKYSSELEGKQVALMLFTSSAVPANVQLYLASHSLGSSPPLATDPNDLEQIT